MTRRKQQPRRRMVQMDLFPAFVPKPPVVLNGEKYDVWESTFRVDGPVVVRVEEAAPGDVLPTLRKRSEVYTPPHHTGPISHATGGPLNADESSRVIRGLSIRIAGYWWPDDPCRGGPPCRAVCKACFDELGAAFVDREPLEWGLGYRQPIWSQEYRGGLVCTYCFKPIRP